MVDNEKYDDEYHFVDPDSGGTDPLDYTPEAADASAPSREAVVDKPFLGKSLVVRNALIVVGVIIAVMVIYPFLHSSEPVKKTAKVVTAAPSKMNASVELTPSQPVNFSNADLSAVRSMDSNLTQKLSALESSQERMQTQVVSTNSQLTEISSNLNQMMANVTELNRIIVLYSTKVDEQSRVIEQLTAQAAAQQKARAHRAVQHAKTSPSIKYYLQAVIPGRAWLMATNGSTITVREGTIIAGLGTVKLIDSRQGRVVISSGQVIRFSQEDS